MTPVKPLHEHWECLYLKCKNFKTDTNMTLMSSCGDGKKVICNEKRGINNKQCEIVYPKAQPHTHSLTDRYGENTKFNSTRE